jgi:hypothetical protein
MTAFTECLRLSRFGYRNRFHDGDRADLAIKSAARFLSAGSALPALVVSEHYPTPKSKSRFVEYWRKFS